ncbi:hypothetical protein RI129_002632 [Pyrocoelia pectoralis]|uniref:Resistance to inhibitors of cholinesterase protein 3 N-terminal domain-containing protein n=1 Tax=Pyrocoelia pectoralis TaxID=417401 RepID=A0AAN7VFN6_9COLE
MSDQSDSGKFQRCQTNPTKMPESNLGTRKTLFVLVIVVGCFAVLWPKVFYPMLVGPTNQRMKPSHLDKGCCDVISDIDINTIKIMTELCNTIVQHSEEKPFKVQDVIKQCRTEIHDKCGIDISVILQEQVRLGRSFKQIVDEVRSFNGSFCLKYQFGISPSKLGISHRVTINLSPVYVKQERPSHLRPEMLHPALRERGSAIVQPYQPPVKPGHPKFVDGRPGPVPGIRPPMGGAGHMVHSQKGSNSMGVIMPIYTVGIVIFFSYTLMKLLFKKKPEGPGAPLYPPVEPSMVFKKEVFESQKTKPPQGPLIVNAMTALLDEVDQELEARRKAREVDSQKEDLSNGGLLNGGLVNDSAEQAPEHEQPSVKILGMEMTASCEGGQKWERCESPVIPKSHAPPEPIEPPQEIFLGGTLPAQSQILVADSTVEEETNSLSSSADPPVILASKMTLSVISLDAQENEGPNDQDEAKIHDENAVEDVVDESKYITASGTTAAEYDTSDEEASDIVDEIEKILQSDIDYVNDGLCVKSKNEIKSTTEDDESVLCIKEKENGIMFNQELNPVSQVVTEIKEEINKVANNLLDNTNESVEINRVIDLKDEISKTGENLYDNIIKSVEKVLDDSNEPQDNTLDIRKEQVDSTNQKITEFKDDIKKSLENIISNPIESTQNVLNYPSLTQEAEKEQIININGGMNKPDDEEEIDYQMDKAKDNSESEEESEEVDSEEEIEDVHDDTDANSLDDEMDVDEIEEVIIFEDEIDMDDDDDDGNDRVHVFISRDAVDNIGNTIDEIITDGARRLEIINDIDNNVIIDDLHSIGNFTETGDNDEGKYQNDHGSSIHFYSDDNSFSPHISDLENRNEFAEGNQLHEHNDDVRHDSSGEQLNVEEPVESTVLSE